ncbi:unnamed protein product [Adineta ricciae]|uniref:Aminopeptidase n=1 Tax=Adineta ricciae TaxID=249248 RepID=A0A814LAQ8_ADIRI|nr:unnamed protein product [Adineta ricciae]CAF1112502.1 unnamed protein product [Adineta ricciae]
MKTISKHTTNQIEFKIWQFLALIIAASACVIALGPLTLQYRSTKCDVIYIEKVVTPPKSNTSQTTSNSHRRYVRDINRQEQCPAIPPMCSATSTVPTIPTASPVSTTRSTPSTPKVTRPVITTYPTTQRTTTPDPWANTTRPYSSWRLPPFATPTDYTLNIACPDCFALFSNLTSITFTGRVTISINLSQQTNFLVLHSKNLNITEAKLTGAGSNAATVTYLSDTDMVYLLFPAQIPVGSITLEITYTGKINERDQTGFYRELFWKSVGEISYLLASNFHPIHARQAFPCFDEPSMQASFTLTLEHPNTTVALSNLPTQATSGTVTTFAKTDLMSTYSLAWAILPIDEFPVVTQMIQGVTVNVRVRPELLGASNANLDWTFDVVNKTFQFIQEYTNVTTTDFITKLDLIGVPDLILDEKASASWGLITFREELLTTDVSLNSAERQQTTTKILVEHLLQPWFSSADWWDNIWFGKSLSIFLAYKAIDAKYPDFQLMDQFPIREMMPLMMDDFKPSTWPVSEQNLTNNEQILDYLSTHIYSKGASLLRLLEHICEADVFQTAVTSLLSVSSVSDILPTFYSNFNLSSTVNTNVTAEEFLRSWLEERNYPILTVDVIPNNVTDKNTTLIFRQARYFGSAELDSGSLDINYKWKMFVECDLGGSNENDNFNLTTDVDKSKIKFILESSTEVVQILDKEYLWIKCNKDFYSYQVTEYVLENDDPHGIWQRLELLFKNDEIFSGNDRANLLNDAFILPHGGEIVTYDQTISLVRFLFDDPAANYLPWSVFVWHWNYLMGVEEHSSFFWNFKLFATHQTLAPFGSDINNIVTLGTTHQDKLIKSMLFELLCRVQNPDALYKASELFHRIPESYFMNSTGVVNVDPNLLATVIYYHIQNTNDVDDWDNLWYYFTENEATTSQQRSTILRALGASKETWRLKKILEQGFDTKSNVIETQEFFDLIITISQNPVGRDIVWNFYRHNYRDLLATYGETNRLFNQLITNIVQTFENEYYYFQMQNFVSEFPSSSQYQKLASDQIIINFLWLLDGMAESLDGAVSAGDRIARKD